MHRDYLISFVWLDSNNQFAWINEFILLKSDGNSRYKNSNDETSLYFKVQSRAPIRAGVYSLLLFINFKISNNRNSSSNEFIDKLIYNKSKLIASTKFLVQDENDAIFIGKHNQLDQLKQFWTIKDFCLLTDQNANNSSLISYSSNASSIDECQFTVKSCLITSWSSCLPDPKSIIV